MLPPAMMMLHQLRTAAPTLPQTAHQQGHMYWSAHFTHNKYHFPDKSFWLLGWAVPPCNCLQQYHITSVATSVSQNLWNKKWPSHLVQQCQTGSKKWPDRPGLVTTSISQWFTLSWSCSAYCLTTKHKLNGQQHQFSKSSVNCLLPLFTQATAELGSK